MVTWATGYVSQLNHELARESLLCMSGHAKRLPEANFATVHVCCQRIQLKSSSLSLSFTPNLWSGSVALHARSHGLGLTEVYDGRRGREIFERAHLKFTVSGRSKQA